MAAGHVQVDRRRSNAAVERQLRPFVLNEVVSTENTLGTGSYGSVLEVCSWDSRLCCGLRYHANGQLLIAKTFEHHWLILRKEKGNYSS